MNFILFFKAENFFNGKVKELNNEDELIRTFKMSFTLNHMLHIIKKTKFYEVISSF